MKPLLGLILALALSVGALRAQSVRQEEDINREQSRYVSQNVSANPASFASLYEQHLAQKNELLAQRARVLARFEQSQPSAQQDLALLEEYLGYDQRLRELELEFRQQVQQAFGPRQVLEMFLYERQFNQIVLEKYKE